MSWHLEWVFVAASTLLASISGPTALTLVGFGALRATSILGYEAFKWLRDLYWVFISTRLARGGSAVQTLPARDSQRMFANTYLVTAFNPKGILFFCCIPAAVRQPGRTADTATVVTSRHLRDRCRIQRDVLYPVRGKDAPGVAPVVCTGAFRARNRLAIGRRDEWLVLLASSGH